MRAHTTTPPHGKIGLIVDNTYPRTHTFPPRQFDNIYKLEAVPVATVQLRFNGWVTELQVRPSVRPPNHFLRCTLYGKTQGEERASARLSVRCLRFLRCHAVCLSLCVERRRGGRRMRVRVCNQGLESPISNPPHPNLPPPRIIQTHGNEPNQRKQ